MKTAIGHLSVHRFFRACRFFLCCCGLFAALLGSQTAVGADSATAQAYEAAKAYLSAQSLSTKLKSAAVTADQTLPPASQNPAETTYYTTPDAMASGALDAVNQSDSVGSALRDKAGHAASLAMETDDAQSAFAREVQANAGGIIDGTYENCGKETLTRVERQEKTCEVTHPAEQVCEREWRVVAEKSGNSATFSTALLAKNIRVNNDKTVSITMPVASGVITALQWRVYGDSRWPCGVTYALQLNGRAVARGTVSCLFSFNSFRHLDFSASHLAIPFDGGVVRAALIGQGDPAIGNRLSGNLFYQKEDRILKPQWGEWSCPTLPALCTRRQTRCLDSADRLIDGMAVQANCWREQAIYHCDLPENNTCMALNTRGCSLQRQQCLQTIARHCVREKQTWSCPHTEIIRHRIPCSKPVYCEDGECQDIATDTNTDFGKSATELKAASMIGEDIRSQSIDPDQVSQDVRVFTGRIATCRDVTLGSMNCCRDQGWARGVAMRCNQGEQRLGQAKEKGGLVVAVGRYCSHRSLGICLEHKQSYCLFPSRIARDIQVDGRQKQLHRGFGSPVSPDCSGLSMPEIQQLDFRQIDFSNAIAGIEAGMNLPTTTALEKRLAESIARQVQSDNATASTYAGRD